MQLIKKRLINGIPDRREGFELLKVFEHLYATQSLGSAGVAFTTTTWQTTNAVPYLINGVTYTKAAVSTQAVPTSLAWTGVASTFNAGAFVIALDSSGAITLFTTAITSSTASAANALAALVWPVIPENFCVIGAVIIQSTTANTTFTPGTTNLNAAGITSTFINTQGPFYPAIA